jgi:hypothetical protein
MNCTPTKTEISKMGVSLASLRIILFLMHAKYNGWTHWLVIKRSPCSHLFVPASINSLGFRGNGSRSGAPIDRIVVVPLKVLPASIVPSAGRYAGEMWNTYGFALHWQP